MKTKIGIVVALGETLTAASFTPKDRFPLAHHKTGKRKHRELGLGMLPGGFDVYSGAKGAREEDPPCHRRKIR